jgi:hypothetical protein
MDKVLAKTGARHNMENLFTDTQSYIQKGILQSLEGVTQSFGLFAERGYNGEVAASDTSMKVTYTSPGSVNVDSGSGLTSEMFLLNVTTPQAVALTGSGVRTNTLYVKHVVVSDGYTGVINGYNYVAGQNLTATRELDSYEFVWDTNPGIGVSGLVLANVTCSGTVVTGITDRRHENLFVLNTDALPGTVVRNDWATTQSLNGQVNLPALSVYGSGSKYILFDATSGTSETVTITPEIMKYLNVNKHVPNTDTHTTNSTFKVGGPSGADVLLATGTALEPLFPHIVEIYPDESIEFIDASMSTPPYDLPIDIKSGKSIATISAAIKFDLSWKEDATTVSSGICTFSNGSIVADEYNGYHMYVDDINKDFVIVDTVPTVSGITAIYFTNVDGSTPVDVFTPGVDAYIHSGAQQYEITATPYEGSTLHRDQQRQWNVASTFLDGLGNPVTDFEGVLSLPIGQKYKLQARAITQFTKSDYVDFAGTNYGGRIAANSGNYISIAYIHPYVAKFPAVTLGSATISLLPTYSGFKVVINPGSGGWTLATGFEVAWTSAQGGVNYTTPNYQRTVTTHTEVEIATPGRYTYSVSVRPLTGGQVVGEAKTGTIVSGAGGAAPNDSVLSQVPINFRTYQGLITYAEANGTNEYAIALSNIATPAYSGILQTSIAFVNGTFASDLTSWYNHYGAAAARSETAWDTGRVKMQVFPGSGAELAQGVIIPSGVSNAEITYYVERSSIISEMNLVVRVFVVPVRYGGAPIVAGGSCIAQEIYTGVSGSGETRTIKAAIPAGNAGARLWIEFTSSGPGGSNYYYIDNVTGVWKYNNYTTWASTNRDMAGEILTDVTSGRDYQLSEYVTSDGGTDWWLVRNVTGGTGGPTTNGIFRIGTSERARLVYVQRGFLIDYEITRAYFDCDVLRGSKCRVRWYQEGVVGKSYADSLLVTANDAGFLQASDIALKEDFGDRNLIVDLYDDGVDPNNFSGITGTLVIFGRPLLQ